MSLPFTLPQNTSNYIEANAHNNMVSWDHFAFAIEMCSHISCAGDHMILVRKGSSPSSLREAGAADSHMWSFHYDYDTILMIVTLFCYFYDTMTILLWMILLWLLLYCWVFCRFLDSVGSWFHVFLQFHQIHWYPCCNCTELMDELSMSPNCRKKWATGATRMLCC